jgi:tungstate transport system substrate-binding protein
MPAHKETTLQICIICFLVFMLGARMVVQYPQWFNGEEQAAEQFITLGSATSAEDSGFLRHVLPIFLAATGLDVHVEAVGTGRALAIGARGDVDALLVHDKAGEDKFVAHGDGVDRRDVMYNDFVIVGPSSDPAGISGLKNAGNAFAQIAEKGALFASRGDGGGTYRMELRLWKLAGVEPNLEILTEGDPILFNLFGSILVNPTKWPAVKFREAEIWQQWLTSRAGLDAITSYRIAGEELFFPPRQRL